jgi:membrane protease YdiL (CAAX protease family)
MNPRLRALGRLLVYAALVFIVLPAKGRWLRAVTPGADGTVAYVLDHLINLAVILGFGSIMATLERRPFAAFGLPWRQALRSRFWNGAGAGIVSLAILVLALNATGAIQFSLPRTSALQGVGFALAYAILFVLLAVFEEFLYRGYGLFTLTEIVGFWPAAIASTVWFAWSHAGNSGESALGLANLAAFGLLSALLLRRTGNLWMAIGFHSAWNWGETYLFGVGDSGHPAPPGHLLSSTVQPTAPAWLSGASVGPEGSALCAVLIAVLIIVCAWVLRGAHYPDTA